MNGERVLVSGPDFEGDALPRLHDDRVREPEGQLQVGPLELRAVADAADIQLLRVAVGHALHHIGDERADQARAGRGLPSYRSRG